MCVPVMFMFSFVICSAKRTSFISFLRGGGGKSFLMTLCYDSREISAAISDCEPFCCSVPAIRWLDHEKSFAVTASASQ
jgi:hypothetical protein